jgi:hypothetical protein
MARHKLSTSVGGGIVNHSNGRPGILTVPNHNRQTPLQQVAGIVIQDNDIYGWGCQFKVLFASR